MTAPIPKRRLNECTVEIAKATVPIYALSQGKLSLERSGVLFRVAERHLTLTCAHDIRKHYIKYRAASIYWPND